VNRPRGEVRVFADAEELSRAAAREFVRLAQHAVAVALGGGSTPRRVYELLVEPDHREAVDWGRVESFWGDERAVAPEHPDSNYGMATAALLFKLALPPERIHRIQAERPNRDAGALEYQLEIARALGVPADGPPPPLDLILLGMGGGRRAPRCSRTSRPSASRTGGPCRTT
jgi:6-phosphogluconolactonase